MCIDWIIGGEDEDEEQEQDEEENIEGACEGRSLRLFVTCFERSPEALFRIAAFAR